MKPTQEEIKKYFSYNKRTGIFRWKICHHKKKIGKPAGYLLLNRGCGHKWGLFLRQHKRAYSASYLAWIYVTGKPPIGEVDHRDRNCLNNRWNNLREATRNQNQANTKLYKNNTSGFRGVQFEGKKPSYRFPKGKPYRVLFKSFGKKKHLGYFATLDEASAIWRAAAIDAFGEFANV